MMLSDSTKIPYEDTKKKLHLLVLISKIYLSLTFGNFWDTLYITQFKNKTQETKQCNLRNATWLLRN